MTCQLTRTSSSATRVQRPRLVATYQRNECIQLGVNIRTLKRAPTQRPSDTHRLPGLDAGRPVRQDGFEDWLQGLEHLLAFNARAQLDAQEAGQRSCRPLLLTFTWQGEEWE